MVEQEAGGNAAPLALDSVRDSKVNGNYAKHGVSHLELYEYARNREPAKMA